MGGGIAVGLSLAPAATQALNAVVFGVDTTESGGLRVIGRSAGVYDGRGVPDSSQQGWPLRPDGRLEERVAASDAGNRPDERRDGIEQLVHHRRLRPSGAGRWTLKE